MKKKHLIATMLIAAMTCGIQLTASGQTANAQSNERKRPPIRHLTRKQAQKDINSLIYTFSEVHPNMYAVCGQDRLLTAADSIKRNLPDSLTRAELYMSVAPLVAMIGDGHSCLRFPYHDTLINDYRQLPIDININTDNYKMTVWKCIDNAIPEDAEVLSINDISTRDILEEMMRYNSGERYFFRLSRVSGIFNELFTMLYAADKYKITYREDSSQKTKTVTLNAIGRSKRKKLMSAMTKEEKQDIKPDYSFEIDKKHGVAVMDFRSFDNPKGMTHFADSMFTVMRKNGIRNLIIDIRNNGGGSSKVGDNLLKYISPQPFTQFWKVISRKSPTVIKMTNQKGHAPEVVFSIQKSFNTPLTAEEGRFDGNVYLLISHNTFSSAASFSWAFKQFGMGTVIGEESGGMNVCFGDVIDYELPESGLDCSISWKRFWHYGADENDVHGTLPDIIVPQEDALDKALEIIAKKK